jgi:hypothetical protein
VPHLALLTRPCHERFSPPPVVRAGGGGARSAHRARRPPRRAKSSVGGDGACAPLVLVRPPGRAKPAAGGDGDRALPAPTTAAGIDWPLPSPLQCCICMFQLFLTLDV